MSCNRCPATLAAIGMLQAVAGPTRRLHPCRMRREGDRQQSSMVVLLPQWLTLILRCDRPVVGPGAFSRAPPRAGAIDYFDGSYGFGPRAFWGKGRRSPRKAIMET